ncbi:hypothetical protein ABEB36_007748 [Hypothenemus hampei]|uniref:Myb-binding protein 1A n=1 Tax=Hypothenemus hampei TaxID=57062 RepID=A0ABD1EY39_HYPHA
MDDAEVPNENHENSKRKLEKTILDNFSKLVNKHENVRVKSASNLLKYLVENDDSEKGEIELKYALKRLVRGLGAQAFEAKAGFYATLMALIHVHPNIKTNEILELIKTELHKSGKNSDAENADICVGQVLACGAIIRGNLWAKTEPNIQEEVLNLLVAASKERSYLKLFGYSFIEDLIKSIPNLFKNKCLMAIISTEIEKNWDDQSLDSLYLLLVVKEMWPNVYKKSKLKQFLETSDIICDDSLKKLCNILMAIPRATSLNHPIYNVIVTSLSPNIVSKFFDELSTHLRIPNRNRLLVYIKIVTNFLSHILNKSQFFIHIPDLITKNFVIQLLGYFRTFKGKQRDKEYNNAVQTLFNTLIEVLKTSSAESNVKISIIKKFLFDPGTFIFEKVTKSKIIQQITLSLDMQGIKTLASVYRGVTDGTERINSENESEIWLNNDRLYGAHLLIKLLNMPTMKLENEWKLEQLKFLLQISLLREQSGMNVGRELAETVKLAFFGALDLKLSKLDELHTILMDLVQYLDEKLNPENLETVLRTSISEETYQLWKKTLQTVENIKKSQKKSDITSVFLTLFLHMALQLFNDMKLATDSLNELFSCYERVEQDGKTRSKRKSITVKEDENNPHWLEVVIDLFLNLLSHNSHLLRSVINSVFPHLCKFMTATTINQILSVLDPQNEENPLSKGESDDSESEVEDEENSETEEELSHSEDEENSDDEDDEDNEDNKNETGLDKLRMALHHALSNGTNHSDDEILGDVFRQYRPNHGKRKKQTKDQEALTHFRLRVLDLVDIYLDSNPSMLLALEIMLPLLQAVEFSVRDEHQKPLNERLGKILKKLLGLKTFSDTNEVNDEILVDLLKSLLDKSSKNVLIVQEMGEQIADCCIFVVKCSEILRNSEGTKPKVRKHIKDKILEVISGELLEFFNKRDSLTPYVFFKNLIQISWEGNIGLATILLGFIFNDDIRQFKKNQVTELLKLFFSNQRFFSQFQHDIGDRMIEAQEEFSCKIIKFFRELCDEPDNKTVKERYICNLFNLLSALKQCPIDQSKINWSEIGECIREYRSYKSFSTDAKIAFNKLCKALGVSSVVQMKQQITKLPALISNNDKPNENGVVSKNEKKKKRKNNDSLKLKKATKQLRLESLSKGLIEGVNYQDDHTVSEEIKLT